MDRLVHQLFVVGVLLSLSVSSHAAELAIVDVTIIPMAQRDSFGALIDAPLAIPHQTVIVAGSRITTIGSVADVTVPSTAQRIDGRGRYLMPGLTDAHVHLDSSAALSLLVANGVTTVRNMWGTPLHLAWRQQIASGERLGPRIYTVGTIVDGEPPVWPGSQVVTSPADAAHIVSEQRRSGYDAVKLYNRISPSVFNALVLASQREHFPLVGHVPTAVPLVAAITSMRSIDHLTGWLVALQDDHSPFRSTTQLVHRRHLAEHLDWRKLPALVAATLKSGVYNVPTLTVDQWFVPPTQVAAERARPEMRFEPPWVIGSWAPSQEQLTAPATEFAKNQRAEVALGRIVQELVRSGAKVVLGTDCPNPFVVPGFSAHDELQNLVRAGLTPFEALRTATTHAAQLLGDDAGAVAVGQRADLLLLEKDPLLDVAAARHPLAVILAGRYLSRASLDETLEALAASYRPPASWFTSAAPFATPGVRTRVDEYSLSSGSATFGAERVRVDTIGAGAPAVVVAEQVIGAPDAAHWVARSERSTSATSQDQTITVAGTGPSGAVTITVTRQGRHVLVRGSAAGAPVAIDAHIADHQLLAAALPGTIFPSLSELRTWRVGESRNVPVKELQLEPEVALVDVTWAIERLPAPHGSEHALLRYSITELERRARETLELVLDPEGRVLRFSRQERGGAHTWRLINPPVQAPRASENAESAQPASAQ